MPLACILATTHPIELSEVYSCVFFHSSTVYSTVYVPKQLVMGEVNNVNGIYYVLVKSRVKSCDKRGVKVVERSPPSGAVFVIYCSRNAARAVKKALTYFVYRAFDATS